jgi:hypothetical protein
VVIHGGENGGKPPEIHNLEICKVVLSSRVTDEAERQHSQSEGDKGVDSQPPFRFALDEVKNPEPQPLAPSLHD